MHGEKQIYRILIRPVILHGLVNRVLRTKNKMMTITGSEKIHGEAFGLTFEGEPWRVKQREIKACRLVL